MNQIDIELLPHQKEFFKDDARNKVLIGGRGSGKTVAGSLWILMKIMNSDRRINCLVAAPTYKMLKDSVVSTFEKTLYGDESYSLPFTENVIKEFHKGDMRMELVDGSKIYFRSAGDERKADKIRGLTLSKAWIDEIAMVSKKAYQIIQGAMRESQNAELIGTSTPKGFNWLYDFFENNDDPGYNSISGISSWENFKLPEDYIQDMEKSYSKEFKQQEIEGKFIKFEGLIYKEFEESEHLLTREEIDELGPPTEIFWGYDSGYINPRVFIKIEKYGDLHVISREQYEEKWLVSNAIEYMKDDIASDPIYCDPSAKSDIEEMKDEGLKPIGGNNDINGGIQEIKKMFKNGNLMINHNCQNIINELKSYRWDENKDKPVKELDHALDAIRYALYSKKKSKKGGGKTARLKTRDPYQTTSPTSPFQ